MALGNLVFFNHKTVANHHRFTLQCLISEQFFSARPNIGSNLQLCTIRCYVETSKKKWQSGPVFLFLCSFHDSGGHSANCCSRRIGEKKQLSLVVVIIKRVGKCLNVSCLYVATMEPRDRAVTRLQPQLSHT